VPHVPVESQAGVVQVVPLLKLHHLGDCSFDYLVPPQLAERVGLGSVVAVPFGRRTVRAIVVALGGSPDRGGVELRLLESVAEDRVPEELIDLGRLLARRYLCSFESCLRLMAPPTAGRRAGSQAAARRDLVVSAGMPTGSPRLTSKQRALLEAIPVAGISAAGLCEAVGIGRGVLRTLVAKGLVELRARPCATPSVASFEREADTGAAAPRLWPEQQEAVDALLAAYEEPGLSTRLLWGITGSGKTEVYMRLIARALEDGMAAILLVPEIALTPQMIERVRGRFGGRVGVLHSGLAKQERLREYRRIAGGAARVVVGARSAVFAPARDVRLIIIDEAHDGSYKQDVEPRYHARTAALLRLQPQGGLLLEGSATPVVEDMREATGRVRLSRRASGAPPACEVVDMRHQGGGLLLAPRSRDALAGTLRRREQAVVLLNRRGYAGYIHCDLCGHVMMCTDCELSLTYHSQVRRLVCHHCGRAYAQPPACPSCGGAPLTRSAPGTERLDRELRAVVPHERVFRMDSDILTSGARVQAVLGAFSATRPAVLVGTQMVAKGHDFPDVTLVIVADADTGLYIPDFRAAERTFQLLTQVAGRAGRAGSPGRVLVQTWNPDVPCIRMALDRDEEGFYRQELAVRERLGYPPFTDLIRIVAAASQGERAQAGAQVLVERLGPHVGGGELHGPVRLPAHRGRQRWQLLIASRDGDRVRGIVSQAMAQLQEPYRRRGVTLMVDVDPLSFS